MVKNKRENRRSNHSHKSIKLGTIAKNAAQREPNQIIEINAGAFFTAIFTISIFRIVGRAENVRCHVVAHGAWS